MAWTHARTVVTPAQDSKFCEGARDLINEIGKSDCHGRKSMFFVDADEGSATWLCVTLTDQGISIELGEPAA